MLTIYPNTLWSQNVQIENFWSDMNFPKRIINSFQTSWNKLAKLSIRKLTLTSETLYIQFHDVGTYELLPISQKPLKISNWNFTCILQRHIGIRKYQYLNFNQVPHLGPKSHGWSHIAKFWQDRKLNAKLWILISWSVSTLLVFLKTGIFISRLSRTRVNLIFTQVHFL